MKPRSRLAAVALTLSLLVAGCSRPAPVEEPEDETIVPVTAAVTRHALLVGCTTYKNLKADAQLQGPANDAALLRQVLMRRFDFPADGVVTLTEAAAKERGAAYRPTRRNIEREFRRLGRDVKPGDQVVVLLSGHGSQQPEPRPPADPNFVEPDGLDEIFLPADVGLWDEKAGKVAGAIVDDELRLWSKAILDRGASLWFIADCCHSGTLMRSLGEQQREVSMADLGIPDAAIQAARKSAPPRQVERGRQEDAPFHLLKLPGKLTALYASRSFEPTVELPLPKGSPGAEPHGLLTYTLCETLVGSKAPLSHLDLLRRIRATYDLEARTAPIPQLEGDGQNAFVLDAVLPVQQGDGGKEAGPRSLTGFALSKDADGHWQINGGALHGLTRNSILAVHAGNFRGPVGHVRVTDSLGLLRAAVEPCAFGAQPRQDQLPEEGGYCLLASLDCGDLRLRLAVDGLDASGKPLPGAETARVVLDRLAGENNALIEAVAESARAEWLLRPGPDGLRLVPAQGGQDTNLGPFRAGPKIDPQLRRRLLDIARVQNLRRLARLQAAAAVPGPDDLAVKVEVVKFAGKGDHGGKLEPLTTGLVLRGEERVAFRVTNTSRTRKLYVSLIYLGAGYEPTPLYPLEFEAPEPLTPGNWLQTTRWEVNRPWGLENLLVVAVPARGEPIDFSPLASSSLTEARGVTRGERALATPLGRLLQRACFGEGQDRGLRADEMEECLLELRSWRALPRE